MPARTFIVRLALLLLVAGSALAHDFTVTEVAVIFRGDGSYQIDMSVDADALALGLSPSTDSAIVVEEMAALSPEEFVRQSLAK